MNNIYIDTKDDHEIIAVVEEDRLVELYIEKKESKKYLGNIYRGRVADILPGMDAAFVDIGQSKNAYLYVRDILSRQGDSRDIKDLITEGQEIIVQVVKEAHGSKGAKVTSHFTLPGKYIVLTPFSKRISLSRKITDEEEIHRLKGIGRDLQIANIGMILRTKASGIEKEILEKEYKALIALFQKIEREKNFLPCPKLIYREIDLSHQIIRDAFNQHIDRIVVNDRDRYNDLLDLQGVIFPDLESKLYYDKDFNLHSHKDIAREIKAALDRKVFLKSGGYIVVDELEALTAVDVNTGKFTGSKSLEDTVVRTNLEAAQEIAKQIRLRNIGGIIIIDFIDMKEEKDKTLVLEDLKKHLNNDRNRANIIGITGLGLVELTRKKARDSLKSKFIDNCPHCKGSGKILGGTIDKLPYI